MSVNLKYNGDGKVIEEIILKCFTENHQFRICGDLVEAYDYNTFNALYNYDDCFSYNEFKQLVNEKEPYIIFTTFEVYETIPDHNEEWVYKIDIYDTVYMTIYARDNDFNRFEEVKKNDDFTYF